MNSDLRTSRFKAISAHLCYVVKIASIPLFVLPPSYTHLAAVQGFSFLGIGESVNFQVMVTSWWLFASQGSLVYCFSSGAPTVLVLCFFILGVSVCLRQRIRFAAVDIDIRRSCFPPSALLL